MVKFLSEWPYLSAGEAGLFEATLLAVPDI